MRNFALTAVLMMGAVSVAQGAAFFTGTFIGEEPTWNRPLADGTGLSGVGTSVSYSVQPFYVAESGTFTFETVAPSPGAYDTFIFIYQGAFNPATPLANFLVGDDDYSGTFTLLPGPYSVPTSGTGSSGTDPASQITGVSLTAGVQYFAINTTFGNGALGTFYSGIGGVNEFSEPIDVTLGVITSEVPEPGSVSLATLGIGGLLWLSRRTRARTKRSL
jgi:hypothetical protein